MFNISNFLSKFSKTIESTEASLNTISDVIFGSIGIRIDLNDIEVKNYTIFLKSNPGVLNKIFIKKERILREVNNLTNLKAVDIRKF